MSGTDASADVVDARAARAAREQLETDLAGLPALSKRLDASVLDRLERYVALLLAANRRMNLTRVTDPIDVARLHLLDSLAALPLLDEAGPRLAVDLGSGGGLPAIPLAIARPGVRWLLVDSVGKKVRELQGFARELRLDAVAATAVRAEELGRDPTWRGRADLVTARACATLPSVAELALPLLRPAGQLLAWKGPLTERDDELRAGATAAHELGGSRPEILAAGPAQLGGHTFVRITQRRPAPSAYPRRVGEPQRRPLGGGRSD